MTVTDGGLLQYYDANTEVSFAVLNSVSLESSQKRLRAELKRTESEEGP